MKRDRELQRLLLLQVRDGKEPPELSKYPEAEQVYNSALLINDGFVDGEAIRGSDGQYVSTVMLELTSSGHDLLDQLTKQVAGTKRESSDADPNEDEEKQNEPTSEGLPPDETAPPNEPIAVDVKAQQSRIRIGERTIFTRTAAENETVLGVKRYAKVLAKLFRTADEKDLCLAIFGPWGRGKTFLIEQTVANLKEKNVGEKNDYAVVEFKAWKYPSRPEVWVHLYEAFFCNLAKGGWFGSLAFTILAGIYRHGAAKLWCAWAALMLTTMPKAWLLKGTLDYLGKFEFAIAAATIFFVVVFLLEFWTTTSHLRRHYLSGTRHFDKLGLQATIGHDLKSLLRGWIQVDLKSENIRRGLRLFWAATIALVGFIFWRSHETPPIAIVLSFVVVATATFVNLAFRKSDPSPSRVLLVVDDLDRCQADHLLAVMESIKLLLEDQDVSRRVQVVMLVEEDVLKHAIWEKYKSLAENEAKEAIGSTYDGKRIVRENIDKLFTAHLRLTPLDWPEIYEVVMAFGGHEKSPTEPPPVKPISNQSAPQQDNLPETKYEPDLSASITQQEKLLIYAALQVTYGSKHSELGPRALRALMFHYQLARMILNELGATGWSPMLLASFIAARQFTGSPVLKTTQEEDKAIALVAEQVA